MAISCWSEPKAKPMRRGGTGETERRGGRGKAPAQRCARGRGGGGGEAGLEGEMLLGH